MNEPKPHELERFMHDVTHQMEADYKGIRSRVREDAGTAGDEAEEDWKTLLEGWLPPFYKVVTKGRILSHTGAAGPQVDVLVLQPFYPQKLISKKYYLAAGVAAAFECKLTLEKHHLDEAARSSQLIRTLSAERLGTPYKELFSPIIYGVLAHSHSWKQPNSKPTANIMAALNESLFQMAHPRDMLDLVCVADLATWTVLKTTKAPIMPAGGITDVAALKWAPASGYLCLTKMKDGKNFTAIGALICNFLNRLAWERPELRSFVEYFKLVGFGGEGEGSLRYWPPIFSPLLLNSLKNNPPSKVAWDEWNNNFA